jgi:predicted porin
MMKTILCAGALAAICMDAGAADGAVNVYGLVDVAIVRETGGSAGDVTKLTSGVGAGSRLGFKGREELGDGLAAVFLLESGFQADTGALGQGGLLFGRQAYVGLQGGFGTLTAGRQYTPEYLTVVMADPFASGYAGDTKNLIAPTGNSASRMDNSLKYVSPAVGSVSAEVVYGAGEVAGAGAAGRQFGGALDYNAGPLRVRLGYHNRNNDTATLKNTSNAKNTVLAAVYDFGVVKAHVAYGVDKGLNSSLLRNTANPYGRAGVPVASGDSRDLLIGATVPFGPHTWMASWIHKDDRGALDQDATQYALGYRYALSRRTELYAAIAHIVNRHGASYTVGSAIEGGSGSGAVDLGIRHAF